MCMYVVCERPEIKRKSLLISNHNRTHSKAHADGWLSDISFTKVSGK